MRFWRKVGLICTIIIVLLHITLFGNAITYDIATGTLQDFAINYNDNPDDPSAYMNGTPVWDHPGFLGRLIYTGEPTRLTFFNHGPTTSGSRFYFTGTDWSAQSSTGYYREFFIVARAKGFAIARPMLNMTFHSPIRLLLVLGRWLTSRMVQGMRPYR